jgi:hypothetical protein
MHIMIASDNMDVYYHVHPEDFGDLAQMSKNGAYYFDVNVQKTANYFVAYSFAYKNGDDLRSGSGSTMFRCSGGVPQEPFVQNYSATVKTFRSYPLPANQRFDGAIDVGNNTDPLGYTVEMIIGNNTDPSNVTAGCQPVRFKVRDDKGNPAINLVPFLKAAAHISFVAQFDTLYHGHAMFLRSSQDFWLDVVQMIREMNMTLESMHGQPSSSMMDIMMGGTMIGIDTHTGELNCLTDSAVVMDKMGMDPNEFGFRSPFGNDLITIFDFPQKAKWRIFVSFAYLNVDDNSVHLIVADFDANVPRAPDFTYAFPTKPVRSASKASASSGSFQQQESIADQLQVALTLVLLLVTAFL